MDITSQFPQEHILLLRIAGRLDASVVERVKSTWLGQPAIQSIVIDLSQTSFIDSMGLAALVSGLKAARQRGGQFVVAAPSEPVRVILDLTAMDRAFDITDTVEAALVVVDKTCLRRHRPWNRPREGARPRRTESPGLSMSLTR